MSYAKELIERTSTVTTTAVFSKTGNERYLLKSQWDANGKSLVIIMTFPSSADETIFYKGIMPSEKVLDFPVDCNTLTGSVNL